MLPIIIFWFIRRYRNNRNTKKITPVPKKRLVSPSVHFSILLVLLFAVKGHSQDKSFNYEIIRNGNKVGSLRFSETSSGDMDYLKMESDVKTKFIFTFQAHAKEEAVYYNGIMLRSSIYRQLNGNEKANKQHQADNRQYIIRSGEKSAVTRDYPITYNMLSLYSREPEKITRVYSDYFQTFISIDKAGSHQYKITLPDGNYNKYYYKEGVLVLVEIHHSLYSASIVLTR